MRKPSVPIYCRHKASGQAYVRVNGKNFYLGVHGSAESQERYAAFIAELATKAAATITIVPGQGLTVIELAAAYWQFAEGYYRKDGRPTDHIHTVHRALQVAKQLYGHTQAAQFGPLALRAIQQYLVEDGKARKYVNQLTDTIRRMFKWGASQELSPVAAFQALATVPGLKRGRTEARETAPVAPVADEVVDATLPHLPPVVADMVRVQRYTGCRPGEVCGLRPMDLDRSGPVWEYRPASHKTQHHGRERVIFIGPKAQEVLLGYLLRPADAYCFSPAESVTKQTNERRARRRTRVQPSQVNRRKARPKRKPGVRYQKDAYNWAIRRTIERVNRKRLKHNAEAQREEDKLPLLPHWHPNQLRHSAATEIRKSFGLEASQVILGHAKADVTQVYAERDFAKAREVMARIG